MAGPGQIDTTSIAMVADIERDVAAPEEYAFDFVASPTGGAGGSDSVWQFSPMYTDVGLNPNHQYGYRVKARDSHGNETAYSPVRYEYTDIETPEGVSFGQITTTSIQVKSQQHPVGPEPRAVRPEAGEHHGRSRVRVAAGQCLLDE